MDYKELLIAFLEYKIDADNREPHEFLTRAQAEEIDRLCNEIHDRSCDIEGCNSQFHTATRYKKWKDEK